MYIYTNNQHWKTRFLQVSSLFWWHLSLFHGAFQVTIIRLEDPIVDITSRNNILESNSTWPTEVRSVTVKLNSFLRSSLGHRIFSKHPTDHTTFSKTLWNRAVLRVLKNPLFTHGCASYINRKSYQILKYPVIFHNIFTYNEISDIR